MMNMCILILSLLTSKAHAAINGTYIGEGTAMFHKSGSVRKCTEIFVNIESTETEIRVHKAGYICEDLQASVDPYVLHIRSGRLITDDNEDLGPYDPNTGLQLAYQGDGFTFSWKLIQESNKIDFVEEWTDEGVPALTIKGQLISAQSLRPRR